MSESPRAIRNPPPKKMTPKKKLTLGGLLLAIGALVVEHSDTILSLIRGK